MGHEIRIRSYPVSANVAEDKIRIESELNAYVKTETWQEGGSGLYRRIRWLEDKVYFGEDEADAAIDKADRHDYDQIAVKYWEPSRDNRQLWLAAYNELISSYSDVLALKKSQHQIGARELLNQANYRLTIAQKKFKELNKTSKLRWRVKIEYHM